MRAVLRAGLAQARYMNVPLPAAVNESVKLTRALGKSSAAGMVNAVLRRAAGAAVSESDFPDLLERLSVYYCLSRPVAELLYAQFGAEAFPLAAAFYCKPKTTIRVNTLRTDDASLTALLQAEGHTVSTGPWPGALIVDFAGLPAASAAFQKGLFHVQGLASQFAALCVDARPGQQVLDLCAAPGGKSLTLAECMQDNGRLVSGEFAPSRVPLLQRPLTAAASPVPWLSRTMPPSTITLGRSSTVCSAMCPVPAWALSPKSPTFVTRIWTG